MSMSLVVFIITELCLAYILYRGVRAISGDLRTNRIIEVLSYIGYILITGIAYKILNMPLVTLSLNLVCMLLICMNYEGSIKNYIFRVSVVYILLMVGETIAMIIMNQQFAKVDSVNDAFGKATGGWRRCAYVFCRTMCDAHLAGKYAEAYLNEVLIKNIIASIQRVANHLSLMGFVIYKFFIHEKGLIIILILVYVMVSRVDDNMFAISPEESILREFYDRYTGEIDEESEQILTGMKEQLQAKEILDGTQYDADKKAYDELEHQIEKAEYLEQYGVKGCFGNAYI